MERQRRAEPSQNDDRVSERLSRLSLRADASLSFAVFVFVSGFACLLV